MKNLIAVILFLISCGAQAQVGGKSLFSTLGIVGGLGTVSNKDKSIPNIDLMHAELFADLGYRFGAIAPLLQASYRFVGQTTKADTVSNINMGGAGYLIGAGLGLEFTTIKFSAVYDLMGTYTLSKASGGGSKVSYGAPAGFHVGVKYLWSGAWHLLFSFSQVDYKEITSDGTKTKIDDNPLTLVLYGVGLGYRF